MWTSRIIAAGRFMETDLCSRAGKSSASVTHYCNSQEVKSISVRCSMDSQTTDVTFPSTLSVFLLFCSEMLAQHHESLREETVWRREVLPNLCQESTKHRATKSYKRILFVVELVNLWKSHICVPNPNNKRLNMVPHLARHPDFFPYSALRRCKPAHVFMFWSSMLSTLSLHVMKCAF